MLPAGGSLVVMVSTSSKQRWQAMNSLQSGALTPSHTSTTMWNARIVRPLTSILVINSGIFPVRLMYAVAVLSSTFIGFGAPLDTAARSVQNICAI